MGSSLQTVLLIAMMVIAFYFLLLRPQKKRQQAQQKTQNEIQPGTRVLLGSGIFGTVIAVSDKQVVLETGPGSQVTVVKQAIARIIKPGDEYSEVEPVSETVEPMAADAAGDDLPPAVGSGAFAAATESEPARPESAESPAGPVSSAEPEPEPEPKTN